MNKKIMLLALCMLPAISLAQEYTDCFDKDVVFNQCSHVPYVFMGSFTAQNKRAYQEDRFCYKSVCCPHRFFRLGLLYGIFDGHGGSDVAEYLQKNFGYNFEMACGCCVGVEQKMQSAFGAAEKYSLNNYSAGSTAISAYIDTTNNIAHFAWVGDSRAVLESNGAVAYATQDHKPNAVAEKERIEIAGGHVDFWGVWRVNGLAVSRSIGDRDLKAKGKGQIIATPEYKQLPLTKDNHFLVMASDGLWDVMDNEEVVQEVASKIEHCDTNSIAQHLGNMAMQRGSQDNITILIIKINWFKQVDVL